MGTGFIPQQGRAPLWDPFPSLVAALHTYHRYPICSAL
jgi:hypothetical protein